LFDRSSDGDSRRRKYSVPNKQRKREEVSLVRRSLISAAVLSLSLASAGAASAAEWVPKAMGNRVVNEVDWWPTSYKHTVAMGIAAQIRLAQGMFLDLDIPWAIVAPGYSDGSIASFAFGNPTVGVHWASLLSDKLAMHAGGTLTVATLVNARNGTTSDHSASVTRSYGASTRAYADFHRFANEYIFFRGRAGVELRILPVLYYRPELVTMLAIPIAKRIDDVEYFVEIHNEIELRSKSGVGGGLHLQAVFNTNQADNLYHTDTAQLAVEPYLFYDPGRGFYARVGCLVALDEPLGFGFDEYGMASIRVTLGGRW
jgi:hypothetical protein